MPMSSTTGARHRWLSLSSLLALAALVLLLAAPSLADDRSHRYKDGDEITVWGNRVGPYDNPQESYSFFSLPTCRPADKPLRYKASSLGVKLEGDQVTDWGLSIAFKSPRARGVACSTRLSASDAAALEKAVRRHYWFQLYVDELPVWGMVGTVRDGVPLVYTHRHFTLAHNGDRIVEVDLAASDPVPIVAGTDVPLSYSVAWRESKTPFSRRFDRYLDSDFFENSVHWLALAHSLLLGVFLCGVVALILLRTLRSDFARQRAGEDSLDLDLVLDESGWRLLHNDVLRPPRALTLLAAIAGTGAQLLALSLATAVAVGLFGTLYDERGRLALTVLGLYCVSALAAGAVSGRIYKATCDPRRAAGWKAAMAYTALLLPALAFFIQSGINVIAATYGSQSLAGIEPTTMLKILLVWACAQCPLVVLGTVVGRLLTPPSTQRASFALRPIPVGPWYTSPWLAAAVAATMPFGAIFIEIHFVFTAIWSYKFYYVYGFMFSVFALAVLVTLCVAVVATYVTLNNEDWRWPWMSAGIGGFMALYVFAYAVFYLLTKTRMSGVLQLASFFGYVSILASAIGMLTAAVAYLGARWFVNKIYQSKTD